MVVAIDVIPVATARMRFHAGGCYTNTQPESPKPKQLAFGGEADAWEPSEATELSLAEVRCTQVTFR